MGNPKVSVIIPNYNHARYLDQRIQSVLNQTYQDFEVVTFCVIRFNLRYCCRWT